MESVKKSGKTVEEALRYALARLGVEREEVEIKIIQKPEKGLLGIIGRKDAIIEVIKKINKEVNIVDEVKDVLDRLLKNMGIIANLEIEEKEKSIYVDISGDDMALVIGRRGETLDSLQYLLSLAINKNKDEYVRILLDAEEYRMKRKKTLQNLARRLAKKAKTKKSDIVLEPMNPYERRIIHSTLQNIFGINTISRGKDPYRKVVICYNKNSKN
jgi:spoIIIJ-associated protein